MTADIESNKVSATEVDNVKALADHTEHAEGNAFLVDKHGAVRKVPVPSNNPNDPLNFKPWEKWAVIITCCWFCELSPSYIASDVLEHDFGLDSNRLETNAHCQQ